MPDEVAAEPTNVTQILAGEQDGSCLVTEFFRQMKTGVVSKDGCLGRKDDRLDPVKVVIARRYRDFPPALGGFPKEFGQS